MKKIEQLLLLGVLVFWLAGCATLSPDFEPPKVTVSSFRLLPTSSMVPKFEIGLHVINPNRIPLQLFGLTYEIELEGHRVLTGVASELPEIAAYGEGEVLLRASPDIFSTLSLLSDLLKQPRETVNYNFSARLDVGKFLPKINVEKTGAISLKVDN